jgi:hypothetical protein
MESGDTQVVRVALVNEAETALEDFIENEKKFRRNGNDEMRLKILKDYKNVRESNPELFMAPPQLHGDARDEWVERQKVLSDFLNNLSR